MGEASTRASHVHQMSKKHRLLLVEPPKQLAFDFSYLDHVRGLVIIAELIESGRPQSALEYVNNWLTRIRAI